MRVLLSTVGTRGDVQPALAVAVAVRELGHDVRLCVPPNFVQWATELGFEAIPVGIEMRHPVPRTGARSSTLPPEITAEQLLKLRQQMPDLISDSSRLKSQPVTCGCGGFASVRSNGFGAHSSISIDPRCE